MWGGCCFPEEDAKKMFAEYITFEQRPEEKEILSLVDI
jgi:hypothetical protein